MLIIEKPQRINLPHPNENIIKNGEIFGYNIRKNKQI
jgi:hypothetical protein